MINPPWLKFWLQIIVAVGILFDVLKDKKDATDISVKDNALYQTYKVYEHNEIFRIKFLLP